ncbi:MAG: hypothetical protein M1831_005451 [Alyxoria varia]|nr:MAG: hypothetical protein M1831_005451 [Alyxoria varia]
MGPPTRGVLHRIESTTTHYQTFPTEPPKSKGNPQTPLEDSRNGSADRPRSGSSSHAKQQSPLPKGQLIVLAIIALAEQTALNSIAPYLPDMVSGFPDVKETLVGTYVGLVASSFALAQFATNFFWGWVSDRIGRKPVVVIGTLSTAACFVAFGFCRTLWQAILVQALMGLTNGNQGVVSTCLGEITDRSNQSRAFTYLPVVYGLGAITGPIVGGILVSRPDPIDPPGYPFLLPNLVAAATLASELIITIIFLEESLEEMKDIPPFTTRVNSLFSWLWQFSGLSQRPRKIAQSKPRVHRTISGRSIVDGLESDDSDSVQSEMGLLPNVEGGQLQARDVLNRDVILILVTFLIFQLASVAYMSLYPIFGQAKPPIGRGLSPEELGVSLAFAGTVAIVFQVGVFGRLRDKIGNRTTYRAGLALQVIAFILTPFVGYKQEDGEPVLSSGKTWMWLELGFVLIIRTVASVGGLTSALLLITNSARDHTVLGTLNGLAQTLSAAGRAVGPFLAGGLFSLSIKVRPKGEAIAFGTFGAISAVGLVLSFFITDARNLECDDVEEDAGNDDDNEYEPDEDDEQDERHTPLLSRNK